MPIEITGAHPPEYRLQPGDVVMVRRTLLDKKSKKPFDWTYFAIITRPHARRDVFEHIILDEKQRATSMLSMRELALDDGKMRLWFLPEDEWPDGVYVFRAKLYLEGRIDELI